MSDFVINFGAERTRAFQCTMFDKNNICWIRHWLSRLIANSITVEPPRPKSITNAITNSSVVKHPPKGWSWSIDAAPDFRTTYWLITSLCQSTVSRHLPQAMSLGLSALSYQSTFSVFSVKIVYKKNRQSAGQSLKTESRSRLVVLQEPYSRYRLWNKEISYLNVVSTAYYRQYCQYCQRRQRCHVKYRE